MYSGLKLQQSTNELYVILEKFLIRKSNSVTLDVIVIYSNKYAGEKLHNYTINKKATCYYFVVIMAYGNDF